MTRLLLVIFFFEMGLVLIVTPWSSWWDHNYFVQLLPQARELVTNNFVRGAVSGLGVINLAAAVTELVSILMGRPAPAPSSILPSPGMTPRTPRIDSGREPD